MFKYASDKKINTKTKLDLTIEIIIELNSGKEHYRNSLGQVPIQKLVTGDVHDRRVF